MKKWMAMLGAVLAVTAALADSYSVVVNTNSTPVVPMTRARSATEWGTNTAYTVGMYIQSGNLCYLCLDSGTSATNGTLSGVGSVTDGTVTWRSCRARARKGLVVVNDGPTAAYITFGRPASVNAGARLNALGGSMTLTGDSVYQGELTGVSSTTNAMTVLEW